MLFNSPLFIFIFLPFTLLGYFVLQRFCKNASIAKSYLILASLFFYGYWKLAYLGLIISSIFINYLLGKTLIKHQTKRLLTLAISFNLLLLGFFKYTDFILQNVNWLFQVNIPLLNLALPLAISFFTFQQIAFLVDSYQGKVKHASFIDYTLFITFFPQLIAGPIVSHHEVMPQFADASNHRIQSINLARGIFVFSLGLFKKVMIADALAIWANAGFGQSSPDFFVAWQASLGYTFQLYFDFSGYSDMAIGLALMFNIQLPTNFNSPYKAINIQEFWRRWHITLSRFLLTYIYIPLGGNRKGAGRTYTNLLITFILGGIWHGAGWTFILWGLLHGTALVVHRWWKKLAITLPKSVAWLLTFGFINSAWVFFRADSISDAINLFKGMVGLYGFGGLRSHDMPALLIFLSTPLVTGARWSFSAVTFYLAGALFISLKSANTQQRLSQFTPNTKTLLHTLLAFLLAFTSFLSANRVSEFLYFNF